MEINYYLQLDPNGQQVLILDTGYLDGDIETNLNIINLQNPELKTIVLVEENANNEKKWQEFGGRVLIGNFDPSQFLQIVRELIMDRG